MLELRGLYAVTGPVAVAFQCYHGHLEASEMSVQNTGLQVPSS